MKITESWVTKEPVRFSPASFTLGGVYRHVDLTLTTQGVTYAMGTGAGRGINIRTGHIVTGDARVWIEVEAELIIKGDK